MSDLFDNAIDSLEFGIRVYLYGEYETAHKHAILNVFHSIELFLKEKLFRIHPILIYKNIDAPINADSLTVGLREILVRYKNLYIPLDEKQEKTLKDLQRRRNRIEHYKFEPENSHRYVIGKSLKFLYNFLPDHLETALEEHLEEDIFREVRNRILEYEERLSEAENEVARRTTPMTKDDLSDPTHSADCPECGNHSVVVGTQRGDFCFFCFEEVSVEKCDSCAEYFPPHEINDLGLCGDCYAEKSRKW